jgi:hypothetical protein
MTWHVGIDLMRAYASDALGPPAAASVEVHVTSCAQCRELAADVVRATATPDVLGQTWAAIRLATTALPQPRLARWLRRLGLPESDVVLIGGFTGLHVTWAVSVGAAIICAFVGVGIRADRQDLFYLAVAPLIPVLAVAVAFDALDPLRDVAVPTPTSKLRLALLRAAAACSAAVPVTLASGLAIPGLLDVALRWLLPSVALTLAALLLITRFSAWASALAVTTAWLMAVGAVTYDGGVAALTSSAAQAGCAVVAAVASVALIARTRSTTLNGGF